MTPISRSMCLAVCCALLAACSGKSGGAAASLVAVKVNGDELSVPQVNTQLARMQGVPDDQRDAVRKQVVDGLVDQQLLVQQAREMKLDRDPEVLATMEASKAQILSQAYLQKSLTPKAKPSGDAIAGYYAEHPELFSKRRVYRLQEVATDLPLERVEELTQVVASSKGLPDVVAWLRARDAKVAMNAAVRGAEMLPMQTLPRISSMKDGEIGVVVNGRQVTVLQLVASQAQPMDEKQARPHIEQYLTVTRRDELAKAEVARLRAAAKIEYVGDFVKLAALNAPAAAPAASAAASRPATSGALEKGIAGMR
jgi:EpsD family peptidyl-prolyl cis-trans isomerase